MESIDRLKILVGIIVFGSVWGMLECILGSVEFTGILSELPMGAFLGAFVGLGIMAFTRRIYGVIWMQLGMAIVAGLLRLWAPIGSYVLCSALAIMAEGLVFELIFNRSIFNITDTGPGELRNLRTLAFLGIITGFVIFTVGYMFTQILTPILTTGGFNTSNFIAVLPLIFGRGFFAAVFGAISLPVAVLAKQLHMNINEIPSKHYYFASSAITAIAWISVFAYFNL